MTKEKQRETEAARAKLLDLLEPGDEVKTILRHVSRSGMQRSISVIIKGEDYTYQVARLLDSRVDQVRGGIKRTGCGTDMGFDLVYNLSYVLWPSGFECSGKDCPSNDHHNSPYPDKDGAGHHKDGGYALKHRWL